MYHLERPTILLALGIPLLITISCSSSMKHSSPAALPEPQILVDKSPISSLDARVTNLVFFSSSPSDIAPLKNPVYKSRFASSTTAKVHPQISLVHPPATDRVFFTMTVQIRESGKIVRIVDYQSHIDPNSTSSYHSVGVGVLGTGNWRAGNYDVDVHVDGVKVARGYFQVF